MHTERTKKAYAVGAWLGLALTAIVLSGCSNSQLRRTPASDRGVPWFCEINETRDDWQCLQDAERAAHPKPARLPSDPAASTAFAEPRSPLATPDTAADRSTADFAPVVGDEVATLLALPEDGFAVQVVATASRTQAEAFVEERGLTGAMTVELAREAERYYVVLLGAYPTFEDAQEAADRLPASLSEITPWIRPVLSIQAGVLAARRLDGPAPN